MADELFEVRNYYLLGNFQASINEGMSFQSDNDDLNIEKDVWIYLCYLAQGDDHVVLSEVKDDAPVPLKAIKALADLRSPGSDKEKICATVKGWLEEEDLPHSKYLFMVAALVFIEAGNVEEALRSASRSNELVGRTLVVQLYLRLNRVDLAQKEIASMKKIDEDATSTQLAIAWTNIADGQTNEAIKIFEDLSDRNGRTPVLLNGLATCYIQQQDFEAAERFLMTAMEKNAKDPDTLVNLIICYQHQEKSNELINRYKVQVRTQHPNHWWVKDLVRGEELFDKLAAEFIKKHNVREA